MPVKGHSLVGMPEARRRPGPVPRLSRDAVLEVARDLPPDQMTLTAIGAKLGVTGPALYRYFPDRTAILDALTRDALAQLTPPDLELSWEEWLAQAARAERSLWEAHSNLYEGANYRALSQPGLRMLEAGITVLTSAGFSKLDAVCALMAVSALAHSIGWAEGLAPNLEDLDDADELVALLQVDGDILTPDVLFDRCLEITIEGLRRLLPPTKRMRSR